MNIYSYFHADICMSNIILILANFGPENWSRVPDICPGFYSFPYFLKKFPPIGSLNLQMRPTADDLFYKKWVSFYHAGMQFVKHGV